MYTPATIALLSAAFSLPSISAKLNTNADAVAYYDPRDAGGSMLSIQNEPLNIIISGLSDPAALSDRGINNWANSINFGTECLGFHLGGYQAANLGDGNGVLNQTTILREDYKMPIGTCLESLIGGNHFRIWRQNGPSANSGALFLATSSEETASEHHDIIPNGYDIGRDDVVKRISSGTTSFSGVVYTTTAEYVDGLLPVGANGINHDIAIDGRVAVLTIDAQTMGSGLDCKGSSLCGSLSTETCDAAAAKLQDDKIYRTDVDAAATGECNNHCGVFVQGTSCQFTGAAMKDAYAEIKANGCEKCGSKRFDDSCLITVNYVSDC